MIGQVTRHGEFPAVQGCVAQAGDSVFSGDLQRDEVSPRAANDHLGVFNLQPTLLSTCHGDEKRFGRESTRKVRMKEDLLAGKTSRSNPPPAFCLSDFSCSFAFIRGQRFPDPSVSPW